jgi:5-methyltetrahydropteroyltriglutamate--homocysteine methyltransferase
MQQSRGIIEERQAPLAKPKARPPFRADHVGSLLRPQDVRAARIRHAAGQITDAALKEIEDAAIIRLIERQQSIGLRAVTDGECRREAWQWDFLGALDGIESAIGQAAPFKGAPVKAKVMRVTGKIGFSNHPMIDHFAFLKDHATAVPKMTIPSPTMLVSAIRDWRDIVSPTAYPDLDSMYDDLGEAYRRAVLAFYEAGCRYLQFDDCNMSYLCDQGGREKMKARGDDPDATLESWVNLLNSVLAVRPDDMIIATHVCRGNFKSTWLVEGPYEPIAEALLGRIDYDAYFLEYDSDRAGGFEPLRFLPKGKDTTVVLGLITTKTGALEDEGDILDRIEMASKYVDIDRLCLSPQCGFASTEEGNLISEDDQWAKLELVQEIAANLWPDA